MRRWLAIILATALELLCEPLFLLVLLAALVLAAVAPAMHYHQFGEASRMARDAGLSSVLIGGAVVAFVGPVRTFRREFETGTAQVALAHSVSRTAFFLSKTIGCAVAYFAFVAIVSLTSLTIVNGAEIGGRLASVRGDMARLWGPSFALAVAVIVLPLVAGAVLNRFARFRFTLTANVFALVVAFAGAFYRFDAALASRLMPALALATAPALVLLASSAAFAVRFKANAAMSFVALVAACLLPALGCYCLSDALADGGSIPAGYAALAFAVLAPAVAAPLVLGVHFINGRDVQ